MDVGSETFGGSPPNGAGAGPGVGSTFTKGAGKIGVAEEDIVGPAPTREGMFAVLFLVDLNSSGNLSSQ